MYKLKGLCVSAGNAQGFVHIIANDEDNISCYNDNTILVANTLERNITDSFDKNIVGVLAAKGNYGSHGAGNLRARHIPCILRINKITELLKEGDFVKIVGSENMVYVFGNDTAVPQVAYHNVAPIRYKDIKHEISDLQDIGCVNEWYQPRPGRTYEQLRYDIIRDVYASSSEYLFNLPAKSIQNAEGVLEVIGTPVISDVCSFYLNNPEWVIEKAKERTEYFQKLREQMEILLMDCDGSNCDSLKKVFKGSVELLRKIYKYLFLAQTTSDELIELYIDFIEYINGNTTRSGICDLKSDYISNSLERNIVSGGFKAWGTDARKPYVCYGTIDYSEIEEDESIILSITNMESDKQEVLLKDYAAFRRIIPLVYQLSEEFAHFSKSINSFLNWSIVELQKALELAGMAVTMKQIFNMSVEEFEQYVNQL